MSSRIRVTREQLYKQLWAKPTVRLAKEYGVSDVALAKICRRHGIPKPPLGYWAKVQHGHKVYQPPLPKMDDPRLEKIHITPLPEGEREADLQPETQERIRAEKSEDRKIVVLDAMESPHALVLRTERSLHSAAPDDCGIIRPRDKGCIDVAIGKDSIDRAMRIMDALIRAIEVRNMRVVVRDQDHKSITLVEVEDETVDLRLAEMLGERARDLTPEQKRQNEEYRILRPHSPTERHPRGLLVLSIAGERRYARHRWSETDGKPLEDKLNSIVAWLYKEADGIKERRRARENQERRWEEERKQREQAERQRREEEERIKQLDADVSAWHKAQRMKAYIAAVEESAIRKSGAVDPSSELGHWLIWARNRIVQLDPIKS